MAEPGGIGGNRGIEGLASLGPDLGGGAVVNRSRPATASWRPIRPRGVTLPPVAKKERPWLEPALIERVADEVQPPYGLAVRLMGYEGLRWGELAALRRRSVDLLNRRLLVVENVVEIGGAHGGIAEVGTGPGGPASGTSRRAAHAPPRRARRRVVGCAAVHRPACGDLRYSWWRRAVWAPACEAVGVDAAIHALRHSAGKALSNAGVPTVSSRASLGHASAAFSIDVYGHASDADLDEAAARLGAYRDRSLTAGTGLARLVPRG